MFYMVMVAVFIYISISFSTGFLMEWKYQIKQSGIVTHNLNFLHWIKIILAFTFTLAILIVIYYLLFNLFFKRLYGRYLRQLKTTLKELNETSEDYR